MNFRLVIFFTLFVFLISCQKLEQDNIPLAVGIRLSEPIEIEKVKADLLKIKSLGCKQISLEILVQTQGDSAWPFIHETTTQALFMLQNIKEWKDFDIHIIFGHADTPYLYPQGAPSQAEKWFSEYKKTVNSALKLCNFKPKRIVAGVDLVYEKEFSSYWKEWTDSLRVEYNVPISYSCNFTNLHDSYLMNFSDEIGVFYEISTEEEPKKHARTWHQNISQYANKSQKPIIVTHANIYGHETALIEFLNRLRFWSAPVNLISLNSIFTESIFSHRGNYFDVSQDVDFQNYITNYIKNPAP